jgi:hexokinase
VRDGTLRVAAMAHDSAIRGAVASLTPSTGALREMIAAFRAAAARGLAGEPSSLKMLKTFVAQPTGDERGRVVAIDWGGTRGRASVVELHRGDARIVRDDVIVFRESDRAAPAPHVFDLIAAGVERVAGRPSEPMPLGFVYSFPARLDRIDSARALSLTKSWRVPGLVGEDVAALLHAALARRGLDRVRVDAVANDTVAALVLQSYRRRGADPAASPADVGLILGTGTNQAADLPGSGIRNLESGNFDEIDAVATPWDRQLDQELEDPAPGAQRFEKMAGGHYLGEILRRAVVDLAQSTSLFRWPGTAVEPPWSLDSAHVSVIAGDASGDLSSVDALMRGLGVASSLADREALRALARAVGGRTARLIAAGLLGTLTSIDPALGVERVVAVDGAVYAGYPGFSDLVREALRELAGAERAERVRLVYVRDSTSAGVAVIAATKATRAEHD